MRYLATTTTTHNHAQFFSGSQVRAKANHCARVRKRLQHKGTRSATRRLVALSGRERWLKADVNHTISKRIVQAHPHALIGLEHLTTIRERTPAHTARKRRRNNVVRTLLSRNGRLPSCTR